jgi:hypothetical protein
MSRRTHIVLPFSTDDQPLNLKFFRQVFGLSSLSFATVFHAVAFLGIRFYWCLLHRVQLSIKL